MDQSRTTAAATRLQQLQERVDTWRLTRARYSRLPEEFWNEALSLTQTLGVEAVRATLRLRFDTFQKKLGGHSPGVEASHGFVELNPTPPFEVAQPGPMLELSDATGTRLTIRLGANDALDLAALVEAFRRSQP
jgi:hypothetical protein